MPLDDEFLSLIHDVHSNNINGHGYRGYSIVGKSIAEVVVSYLYYFLFSITLFKILKLIFDLILFTGNKTN